MTEIEEYLINKGISVHIKGFDCLVEAVRLMREDKSYKYNITKRLYPDIANMLNETPTKVERAIRHAIDKAKIRMTNSEFIAMAVLEVG